MKRECLNIAKQKLSEHLKMTQKFSQEEAEVESQEANCLVWPYVFKPHIKHHHKQKSYKIHGEK